MSQSPSKRRKLSPEQQATPRLNATPTADRYPSFASPTRSSLSRVAPQILQRLSMENDAPIQKRSALARTPPGAQQNAPIQRPSALARTPPGVQAHLFVTQSTPRAPESEEQEAFTPSRTLRRSPRSNTAAAPPRTAGLTAAPRRPSQSPRKAQPAPIARAPNIFDEPPPDPGAPAPAPVDMEMENPFQKRSTLRRSFPPGARQAVPQSDGPAEEGGANPFQKRSALRRSPPAGVIPVVQEAVEEERPQEGTQEDRARRSMAATERSQVEAQPTPEQAQNQGLDVTSAVAEQAVRAVAAPAYQLRRSMAVREISAPKSATQQPQQPTINVTAGDVASPMPPPPPPSQPAAVAASDGRAALRNQRLRGAQTRSPGQVDFGFSIPAAAPRPPPAPSPLAAQIMPIAPVAAATPVAPSPAAPTPTIPAPFVDSSAPTPTPPTRPTPIVAESPLFVSQTTNSPSILPQVDSSILSIHTPTPAPIPQQRSRLSGQEPAEPEGGRKRVSAPADPEEPELPPTPTQRGIADPTVTSPRTGIHNTPSKRLKRRQLRQSSPLKPRAERRDEEQRSEPVDEDTEMTDAPPANKRPRNEVPSRFDHPLDKDAEKKRKRERMLKEIRQLESDIKLAERENDRVRKLTAAGKELKRPANADQLVEMLARVMDKPASYEEPKPMPSVLDNVELFLPFARPLKPKQKTTEDILKTEDLPSVLPVEVKNPLPFLSAFTPFTFTSSITTLPPTPGHETGEADILQVHSLTTTAPHLLFSSRMSVTVNTRNGAVDRIDIEYLDPAAEKELGQWVRKRAQGGVLGRNINSISWASQQWYESALQRARFWCHIESELSTPAGRDKARRRLRQEARRGRKSQPGAAQEVEEHFEDDDAAKYTPDQLRRHIGRQSIDIDVDEAVLSIHWKIDFDWTGEAQQSLSAVVKASRRWHEMDERKQLNRIPDIFKGLVKERSPMVAARTVVVLLMGE